MVSEVVQIYVVCNIWASLLCRSTQHHSGAGSSKYLERPYGSNLVHYSCPWKSHSVRVVLDKGLIQIVAVWYDENYPIP